MPQNDTRPVESKIYIWLTTNIWDYDINPNMVLLEIPSFLQSLEKHISPTSGALKLPI